MDNKNSQAQLLIDNFILDTGKHCQTLSGPLPRSARRGYCRPTGTAECENGRQNVKMGRNVRQGKQIIQLQYYISWYYFPEVAGICIYLCLLYLCPGIYSYAEGATCKILDLLTDYGDPPHLTLNHGFPVIRLSRP